ncbi:MAG: hypothetical protein J4F45_09970 [Pseudomonadales bacterium]|nr:hypothetical protein [Pseudomonadales bacterium]
MTVLPGGTRLPGHHDVWQCTVQIGHAFELAYVKLVPLYKVVREVVCGLIAQDVGLPVVRPGVALLDESGLPTDGQFGFATSAVDVQALPRIRDDAVFRERLARWPALPLAIAFDDWIANQDRTLENLLFRGASDFVLVDHGDAIPDIAVDVPLLNRLARIAFSDVSKPEENVAVRRVQQVAAVFDQVDFEKIKLASLSQGWGGDAMLSECCRFLSDRLVHLDDLIAQSLGSTQQTLPLPRADRTNQGS